MFDLCPDTGVFTYRRTQPVYFRIQRVDRTGTRGFDEKSSLCLNGGGKTVIFLSGLMPFCG